MKWLETYNHAGCVPVAEVPVLDYAAFYGDLSAMLADAACHILHYFAVPEGDRFRFYCLVADDAAGCVRIASHEYDYYSARELSSLTAVHPQVHPFERAIAEQYAIPFKGNPWPKPLRFPADRADRASTMDNYPFYRMEGESLHEVNVGPVHAGIIEPGAFRFVCNGEEVLHLEIALGYQHRGVEGLMTGAAHPLRRCVLAEAVAGDSSVAHASAHAMAVEKLAGFDDPALWRQRTVALELERMAMHIADTGALCMDVGYQLGQVACEALRTVVINTTQLWCGNRFGRSLVRPGGSHYPLTPELCATIAANVAGVRDRYAQVKEDIKETPTVLARFEECGPVPTQSMRTIGGVGMAARASGLGRDVRTTHPWGAYLSPLQHTPVTRTFGDVMARLTVRGREVLQSAEYILELLADTPPVPAPDYALAYAPESLSFGLIEGWRGETCHVALTDAQGALRAYKIKDPSLHNWMALALSVRGAGISDFPVCNKSFNLSYCGHDL